MKLDTLKELLARATPGPLTVTATSQMYIVRLDGPTNNVSNEMLAWDADAYVALRNAAPALLACAKGATKMLYASDAFLRDTGLKHGDMITDATEQLRAALRALEDA